MDALHRVMLIRLGRSLLSLDMTEGNATPISEPQITTESIVEAILFASEAPLPVARIIEVLGTGTPGDVRKHVDALNARYAAQNATFRIETLAHGYQMLTLPRYHRWVEKLSRTRSDSRLTQAALETLAVVAYKQPVMRAEIEAVRGVAVGEVLNRLRELNLVKVVGRAEEIGRPMLYGTTKRFLQVFGLASLNDLPKVEVLTPPHRQRPSAKPDATAEASPPTGGESEQSPSDDPGSPTRIEERLADPQSEAEHPAVGEHPHPTENPIHSG